VPDADGAPVRALRGPVRVRTLHGWGGADRVRAWVWRPEDAAALADGLALRARRPGRGVIARGMGRSYGDAAQRGGGLAVSSAALSELSLDPVTGLARVGAGVVLGDLLRAAAAEGWIVPVVPGTQFVTVGGAIASDIHGKNHAGAGTFGAHVRALGLLTADGELRQLGPSDPLFGATVGGMGLTGVIVWAQIALAPAPAPLLAVDTDRVNSLDEAFSALRAPGGPHRVAWLDLLSPRGPRGVVTRAAMVGSAAEGGGPMPAAAATTPVRLTVPPIIPSGALTPAVIRAANAARFRRSPLRARDELIGFGPHMFPLDGLAAWPRMYGRSGFVQYQVAVPPGAEGVLEAILAVLEAADTPVYLAVLKDFGPANAFPLSFPIEGWTLALDLPRRCPGLPAALDRCDELVVQAGGRIYLSKDSRVKPATLSAMYPRLSHWREIRDRADPAGLWRSDLAVRTGLVDDR
jgi:decaprenylphospho-beta-D-ribofuranose 2-oxidase